MTAAEIISSNVGIDNNNNSNTDSVDDDIDSVPITVKSTKRNDINNAKEALKLKLEKVAKSKKGSLIPPFTQSIKKISSLSVKIILDKWRSRCVGESEIG